MLKSHFASIISEKGSNRIRIRVHTSDYRIRIRILEAQKHGNPIVWIRIRSEPWLCELLCRRLTEIGTLLPMCPVVFCSILCVLCLLPHNLGPVRLLCPLLRTLLCLAAYSALFSVSSSAPLLCIIRVVQVIYCALICA